MDYSKTVNLPQTDFPMRGNLPTKEPQMIADWQKKDIYKAIIESRADADLYVLHDGPPYANGHIHMGHALNKILKDMIIKHKTMMGMRAPYVPGWDCHGLPIELQVTRELGEKAREMSRAEIRTRCREYARKFVDIQMEEFKRLGIFGNYENPYLTMSKEYEAAIVESLGKLFDKGYIFKGKKPIYWCPTCETALAEAEVEYENHSSHSIYVRFPIKAESLGDVKGVDPEHAYVVIWTTTPWTLPANLGVCLHPEFEYSFYRFDDEYLLLADGLAEFFCGETGLDFTDRIPVSIDEIKKIHVRHPFIDRESKVIFGNHVTLEAGTGIVHTAPGHGMEDYIVGLQFGLEVFCPVDHQGRYTDQYPEMKGTMVFDANDKVIAVIRENGTLIKSKTVEHSYPHCWRCKKPLIFRATEQWFMGMEINGLRQLGLQAVDKTEWIPKWGESRFRSMVESRPDWCLSRQRSWGVPIPSFSCKKCGKNMMSAESIAHFAAIAREKSIDVWYTEDIKNLIPAETKCTCGSTEFEKEYDILDVWFDSGVSHFAVLEQWPELRWPADLYLEGSDQHRGWFQSSLWPALALKGRAPYNTVLTHGFVLDDQGRAMSKSIGNVIPPEKIINQYGADILRLWVSSEDYRNDLKIGYDMMKQIADSYRKIRNTFKYIIGNISDFDEKKHAIPYEKLPAVDRWALYKLYHLHRQVIESYEKYEFHLVYRRLVNFCAVELSSIYFDISKDTLYTDAKDSFRRRAAQTVLNELLKTLVGLAAPVLSFTTEEIWMFVGNEGSVHASKYHMPNEIFNNSDVAEKVEGLVEVKKDVLRALETLRQQKVIGTSIEAGIDLYVKSESLRAQFAGMGDEVTRFFQVAKVNLLTEEIEGLEEFDNSKIKGFKAAGEKCARCWNYFEELGNDPEHPQLCKRCTEVIKELHA